MHARCPGLTGFPITPPQGLGPNLGRHRKLKPLLGMILHP